MTALTFAEARACVLERVSPAMPAVESIRVDDALGRVLAAPLYADRDYPPLTRSIRDGFAVRSADTPGVLRITGEVRAGRSFEGALQPGEAIEIMTGAPLPDGADAVVMVEHVTREGDRVRIDKTVEPGAFLNVQGAEARSADEILAAGHRLSFAAVAALAMTGHACARVYARPRVAILSTGDEVVEIGQQPLAHQVRNSNAVSLAAQVRRAGGIPEILPIAADEYERSRELLALGLESDLLLISGGVSAGKYDIVEGVLADLGAEFFFDRVLIQPGQPLVFGRVRDRFFFGLPGNPLSTMVTFELFARAALGRLCGETDPLLPLTEARLTQEFRHKRGLTRFLPAHFDDTGHLTPVAWKGSSDVPALARANAFLVADSDREHWSTGDSIRTLLA